MVAAIRPDDWNVALLLHVLGAMLLVGGIATALVAQLVGWRRETPRDALVYARVTFRTLLVVAVPGWLLMRFAGEWIASKEGFDGGGSPAWLDVGYAVAEPGIVLIAVSALLAGLAVRRMRAGRETAALTRVAGVLTALLLVAYVVAIWAMTTKPG